MWTEFNEFILLMNIEKERDFFVVAIWLWTYCRELIGIKMKKPPTLALQNSWTLCLPRADLELFMCYANVRFA